MEGYPACYQRAYRCLSAAAEITEDMDTETILKLALKQLAFL